MVQVRENSRFGPCYALGELVGETATRYVYRNRAGSEMRRARFEMQSAEEAYAYAEATPYAHEERGRGKGLVVT